MAQHVQKWSFGIPISGDRELLETSYTWTIHDLYDLTEKTRNSARFIVSDGDGGCCEWMLAAEADFGAMDFSVIWWAHLYVSLKEIGELTDAHKGYDCQILLFDDKRNVVDKTISKPTQSLTNDDNALRFTFKLEDTVDNGIGILQYQRHKNITLVLKMSKKVSAHTKLSHPQHWQCNSYVKDVKAELKWRIENPNAIEAEKESPVFIVVTPTGESMRWRLKVVRSQDVESDDEDDDHYTFRGALCLLSTHKELVYAAECNVAFTDAAGNVKYEVGESDELDPALRGGMAEFFCPLFKNNRDYITLDCKITVTIQEHVVKMIKKPPFGHISGPSSESDSEASDGGFPKELAVAIKALAARRQPTASASSTAANSSQATNAPASATVADGNVNASASVKRKRTEESASGEGIDVKRECEPAVNVKCECEPAVDVKCECEPAVDVKCECESIDNMQCGTGAVAASSGAEGGETPATGVQVQIKVESDRPN